jgi:UDP-N-acetylmuramoyl-tripeptide--D-alanyl-D-alanine ligase
MSAPALTLAELAAVMGGTLPRGGGAAAVTGLQNDSRNVKPGEAFVAIPTAAADGHAYAAHAEAGGAAAAVVARIPDGAPALPLVLVDDTRHALLRFAAWRVRGWEGRIVGITGSSGKSTTKEFTADLLGARYRVFRSPGNFNNTLGIPMALFHLRPEHEVAVLEMGMSSRGEIAALCAAAPPDVAVVTNVGSVHLEFFPDRQALAAAKAEIVEGLKPGGVFVPNCDDPWVRRMAATFSGRTVSFGQSDGADVRLAGWSVAPDGRTEGILSWRGREIPVALPMLGGHYLLNLAAAAAVAFSLGLDPDEVAAAAAALRPFKMRGELHALPGGARIIDDSYNSNPEAMRSVLETLARWPDRPPTLIVAGEMRELGAEAAAMHREVGAAIARTGCRLLVGVQGMAAEMVAAAAAAGQAARFVPDAEAALAEVRRELAPGMLLLVKGSRGVGLDRLVRALGVGKPAAERSS